MSHPSAQPATLPKTYGLDRRLPTAWFLAEITSDLHHAPFNAFRTVYVSRTEDGWYRLLCKGVALLVSEGVAARHLRRVRGSDGVPVRVSGQQRWTETWNENYAEARRAKVA